MNIKLLSVQAEYHEDASNLSEVECTLLDSALEALEGSYSPYSGFSVGAALLLENGEIIRGSNQENGAYPSGLCAERVAFFWAGANRKGLNIKVVAVRTRSSTIDTSHPVTPCGACRQVMLEYELNQQEDIVLLMQGSSGEIIRMKGVKQLLPLYFNESGLKKAL